MSSSSTSSRQSIDASSKGVSDQTRALAIRLSGHMGLDAAIKISSENQWHGVVSVLLEMQQQQKNDVA